MGINCSSLTGVTGRQCDLAPSSHLAGSAAAKHGPTDAPDKAKTPVAEAALKVEQAHLDLWISSQYAAATPPAADDVEALPEEDPAVDEATYHEALARCADLRRARQALLRARIEVKATIAQFAPAFEDPEESQSSEDCPEEREDERMESDKILGSSQAEAMDMLSYKDALAQQEELEDEIESLTETLEAAGAMIAPIVAKSQALCEQLEDVESRVELSAPMTEKAIPNATSDTIFDDAAFRRSYEVHNPPPRPSKRRPEDLKLPDLNFLTTPGATSAGSEASSSTATPRSEKSSESRMASARSEKEVCAAELMRHVINDALIEQANRIEA